MSQEDPQRIQPMSSGRWDAAGSWNEAVQIQQEKALKWVMKLSVSDVSRALLTMAEDTNAFTLYERKALLEVASDYVMGVEYI